MTNKPPYQRVLLKISGEILSCKETDPVISSKSAICQTACRNTASGIKSMHDLGMQIGVVVGAGNIFRGIQAKSMGLQRTPADQMGMLSTLINGIALQQALEAINCPARVLSALDCPKVAESYNWRNALEYLKREVVIFVGGTGNPYFTTDTAAALRASEIQAEVLLKATKVDGIFNKDPLKYQDAQKYNTISYSQVLAEKLQVMDATSIALCMNNHIPIFVFNMLWLEQQKMTQLLMNQTQGTLVNDN